mmetsp:Transcript_49576/g.128012  ORF Transcript_49576/g.128012 Transcript_49576/m.128012 type:complete len:216 (-) Transcript_49576:100-747(-)
MLLVPANQAAAGPLRAHGLRGARGPERPVGERNLRLLPGSGHLRLLLLLRPLRHRGAVAPRRLPARAAWRAGMLSWRLVVPRLVRLGHRAAGRRQLLLALRLRRPARRCLLRGRQRRWHGRYHPHAQALQPSARGLEHLHPRLLPLVLVQRMRGHTGVAADPRGARAHAAGPDGRRPAGPGRDRPDCGAAAARAGAGSVEGRGEPHDDELKAAHT